MHLLNLTMWHLGFFTLSFLYQNVYAVENINRSVYYQMPPLYRLDSYEQCLDNGHGHYCIANIEIESKNNSPLYEFIIEYSSNEKKHYRHDLIHRGICLTKSCRDFFDAGQEMQFRTNESLALNVLERCINSNLNEKYGLQGRARIEYCNYKGQVRNVDNLDIAVAIIILVIFICNIASSIYDVYTTKTLNKIGNAWMLAFSFHRNWKKLMTIEVKGGDGRKYDPRLDKLKGLQGMRFLTMLAVIFSHVSLLLAANYLENPLYVEVAYEDPFKQFLYNGSVIMQTYFCIASFLVAYNFMLYTEKNTHFNIWVYPKGVIHRWLRLVPIYALTIAFVATWQPHLGYGPLWDRVVTAEQTACRASWWNNILFFNNYLGLENWCLPQSWYLGADSQLFCYSLALMMVIWKYPNSAKYLFPSLLVIATLIPGIITYIGEYDAIVIQSPESYRTLYRFNRTFIEVYQRGHTNLAGATIGSWAGYCLYYMQKNKVNLSEKTWLRIYLYIAFPAGVGLVLSGAIFYQDDYVYNPISAAIYAGLYKTVFAFLVISLVVGVSYGLLGPYAAVLEWRPFQIPGKLTYSALFVHPILQRGYVGSLNTPFFMTDYGVLHFLFSSTVITYIFAVPLCIMVEMPANTLQKLLLEGTKPKENPVQPSQIAQNITLVTDKDNTKL